MLPLRPRVCPVVIALASRVPGPTTFPVAVRSKFPVVRLAVVRLEPMVRLCIDSTVVALTSDPSAMLRS